MIFYDGNNQKLYDTTHKHWNRPYMQETGDLQDGDTLILGFNNVVKNKSMVFTGIIGTFSEIEIGTSEGNYIRIDATNMYVYNNGNLAGTYPHGLTVQNNLQVMLKTRAEGYITDVTVVSNGISFKHEGMSDSFSGTPMVKSVGSTFTDCVFAWTSKDLNADIWIFGDSYLNLNYDYSWGHYLMQDGYGDKCLIAQSAGINSHPAFDAFKTLIEIGNPKYIVYCLGMNEGDTATVIPLSWTQAVEGIEYVCKERGIELILATIPNVPTYAINNLKNAYVKESGHRYIDFAKAVNAEGTDRQWYDGLLENNGTGVHPTAQGAKVLYMQALADFPEFMGL